MRLTRKLLGFLNRPFSRDPDAFLAFRLQYAGGMQWTVFDGTLTTAVQGGPGVALSIDLAGYTVHSLCGYLALQPGYSVVFEASADLSGVSALRLLEGSGDPALSNGDHLLAYTSLLYALFDAYAVELAAAEDAIVAMPDEMATVSADGSWLDFLGSYYAVPRLVGEPDPLYAQRIITEVLRPLGNNVAIENAIAAYTGQAVTITDVVNQTAPEPKFDGTTTFDGTHHFQPQTMPIYGLFDAVVGYDLLGGDVPTVFTTNLISLIERLRDAGTHLRAISLGGSQLQDTAPAVPTDLTDSLIISHRRRFDGTFSFNGVILFAGAALDTGTIEGVSTSEALDLLIGQLTTLAGPVVVPDGAGGTLGPAGVSYPG